MTVLEIILLLVGIAFLIGSFFVTEKLSSSDMEQITKISKEEVEQIVKDRMADANVELEDKLKETIDNAMEELDAKTDKETTAKIMNISEFSDTVLESIDKSHNEVMFMYSMLNEKQQTLTDLTKDVQAMTSQLAVLNDSISKKIVYAQEKEEELKAIALEAEKNKEQTELVNQLEEEINKKYTESSDSNANKEIMKLYDEGLSEVDIAKKLGKGLGEVKFVISLFDK